MEIKLSSLTEESLLKRLQEGDTEAFKLAIKRYGSNTAIAAYAWTEDVELATKLVESLYIKLQGQCYKNAFLPLEKYLIGEVKAECTLLFGFP